MNKIGSFKILNSFTITGRGLVLLGDLIDGNVKVGATIIFKIFEKEITRKVTGVEMADNLSTREFWVGLTFMTNEDIMNKEFEGVKIGEQTIDIFE